MTPYARQGPRHCSGTHPSGTGSPEPVAVPPLPRMIASLLPLRPRTVACGADPRLQLAPRNTRCGCGSAAALAHGPGSGSAAGRSHPGHGGAGRAGRTPHRTSRHCPARATARPLNSLCSSVPHTTTGAQRRHQPEVDMSDPLLQPLSHSSPASAPSPGTTLCLLLLPQRGGAGHGNQRLCSAPGPLATPTPAHTHVGRLPWRLFGECCPQ